MPIFSDIDSLYTNLKCLSDLKRFKTQLMFLSSEDKQGTEGNFYIFKKKIFGFT